MNPLEGMSGVSFIIVCLIAGGLLSACLLALGLLAEIFLSLWRK
jgi:hypothetical protein